MCVEKRKMISEAVGATERKNQNQGDVYGVAGVVGWWGLL